MHVRALEALEDGCATPTCAGYGHLNIVGVELDMVKRNQVEFGSLALVA